jgi:hypothetical protein
MLTPSSLFAPPYFGNFTQVLWYCQKHLAITVFGICTHVISYSGNAVVFYIAFRNTLLQEHFNITFIYVTCFILSVYEMLPHENSGGLLRSHHCNWRYYIPSFNTSRIATHPTVSHPRRLKSLATLFWEPNILQALPQIMCTCLVVLTQTPVSVQCT